MKKPPYSLGGFSLSKPKTEKTKNAIIESSNIFLFLNYTLCKTKKYRMLIFKQKSQLNQILNNIVITQKLHNFYRLLIFNEN